jgi:hypothetical protein
MTTTSYRSMAVQPADHRAKREKYAESLAP